MKKQQKLQKPSKVRVMVNGRFRWLFIVASIISVAYLGYLSYGYGWAAVHNYKTATNLANTEQIRELILRATKNLGVAAPVEARTGDTYFPQAKLYLPAASSDWPVAYTYTWDSQERLLSIRDTNVYERNASLLVQAADIDQLFARVPKLQACARGVVVTDKADFKDWLDKPVLQETVTTTDRTLYVYTEKACPDNAEAAHRMAMLRAY
jgi:hypothetical protein